MESEFPGLFFRTKIEVERFKSDAVKDVESSSQTGDSFLQRLKQLHERIEESLAFEHKHFSRLVHSDDPITQLTMTDSSFAAISDASFLVSRDKS